MAYSILFIALWLALLPWGEASARSPLYELSENISARAASAAARRVAVLTFEGRGGASDSDGAYTTELVTSALSASGKVVLVERALLAGVLKESGMAAAAGAAAADGGIFEVDAVVTGMVFPEGEGLKVFAKLVEVRSGRVLLASLYDGTRPPGQQTSGRGAGLLDRRDSRKADCTDRRMLLAQLNRELVIEKAKYWAARMLQPGFRVSSLRARPGEEIAESAVRERFHELLAMYYAEGNDSGPLPERRERLDRLLWLELLAEDECGAGT